MADLGGVLNIGSSLLGGFMESNAAEEAAEQQERMARMAIDEQRRQYDTTRADLAPWRQTGTAALGRLNYLMGLGDPSGVSAPTVDPGALAAAEQRYQNLLAQQGTGGAPGTGRGEVFYQDADGRRLKQDSQGFWFREGQPGQWRAIEGGGGRGDDRGQMRFDRSQLVQTSFPGGASSGDLDAARAEVDRLRAASANQGVPMSPGAGGDYGSLLRNFSLQDFQTDPGYQFRLAEGSKAINRQASALGRFLSGGQAKALTRYGQEFASNEFGRAYDRDAANKQRIYNMLSGVAGTGQTASTQTGAFGQQAAGNIGNLQTQIGNVQAAGTMGQSGAWQNALGNVGDYFQTQNLLNRFKTPSSGGNFINLRSSPSRY